MSAQDEQNEFNAVNAANGETSQPIEGFDPDAPYGRKLDGTPKKKSGPSKGTRVGAAIPRPTRTKTTRTTSSAKKTGTDYTEGIQGLLQIPAGILGMAGQFNEDLALDGAAIAMHSPALSAAISDLANDQPAVAAALDRILTVGPYGAILGALLPLAFQIGANHRKLPDAAVRGGGALPRDEFRAMLIAAQPQTA